VRNGFKLLSLLFLGLCASLGCGSTVRAAPWLGYVSVITTNNVTEAQYVWFVACCDSVVSTGPLTRSGNTFWYDFDISGPWPCPCLSIRKINTTVTLGVLDPGVYTLITTAWGVPGVTNTFTVPTVVLKPAGFTGNGSFQIEMLNGITNANYVLQCSTNFADWTSLSTNSLMPLLTDTNPVFPGPCFYRVQVLGP
jgi:hypothetical protein